MELECRECRTARDVPGDSEYSMWWCRGCGAKNTWEKPCAAAPQQQERPSSESTPTPEQAVTPVIGVPVWGAEEARAFTGDARFVGADGNRDPLSLLRGRDVEVHLGAVVGGDIQHGIGSPEDAERLITAAASDTRDPLRFRYNPESGNYDPPTPAAMLGEALEHIRKARRIVATMEGGAHAPQVAADLGVANLKGREMQWHVENAIREMGAADVRQRYAEKHGGREDKE